MAPVYQDPDTRGRVQRCHLQNASDCELTILASDGSCSFDVRLRRRAVVSDCLGVLPRVLHAPGAPALVRGAGGPAPPIPPAVVARDGAGHVTVRAVRVAAPMHVDGRLDEEVYETTSGQATSCSRSRTRDSRRPSGPRRGSSSTTEPLRRRRGAGTRIPSGWSPTRCGATPRSCGRTTRSPCCSTRITTGATAFLFYANPIGGFADQPDHRREPAQRRLEHGLGRARPRGSTAAGRSRWRSRSSRCATARAATRPGASTCAGSCAGRTSGRTSRRFRAR